MTNEARNNLILSMNDPSNILYSDEFVVIVADQYPKSEHHYLVMPKEDLFDVRSLKEHHISKLIYMELKGLEYVMRTTGLFAQDLLWVSVIPILPSSMKFKKWFYRHFKQQWSISFLDLILYASTPTYGHPLFFNDGVK